MNIDRERVKNRGTDMVFERGINYRDEGRIQQFDRFGRLVAATISDSKLHDVTVKFDGRSIDARRICLYDGSGDCKHVVAVLLDIAANLPQNESECVEAIIDDMSAEDLHGFARDALTEHPELREQPPACFDDDHRLIEEYREEVAQLFEQHIDPVVFEIIDFSRFLKIAEQYRDRERYLAAATVYRTVFEETDEKYNWTDGIHDHYAKTIQTALDDYADCVLATNPTPEEFGTYAGMLEARATAEPRTDDEQFRYALNDLEERYKWGSQ